MENKNFYLKKIRTLTMYLPQYYRTLENDMWWGEGFTDWTAVKEALPMYKKHVQPKIPLKNNYYNLLDKRTMLWQADLMKQYGIDGQCIYHYYFKDGRKILEKPVENLLKWKDIDMPFCFCWANLEWRRTWNNDSWADKFRQGEIKNQILIPQKYGNISDWEQHFQYLLPFFQDDRYIKVDNAPVFVIYYPNDIYCLETMNCYFKERAKQEGFRDLYIIISSNKPCRGVDAIWRHTPHSFWNRHRDMEKNGVFTFDYDILWNRIIDEPPHPNCTTYFEGMANCDDTPRRGGKGIVLQGFNIQAFHDGMVRLYEKSLALNNEFVFINAWNEWGEGMYLEPDEQYGYQVLEALRQAQKDVCGRAFASKADNSIDVIRNQLVIAEKSEYKFHKLYRCMDRWMLVRERGKRISDFLRSRNIKVIALYGYGVFGQHALEELGNSDVYVKYIIDQNFYINNGNLRVYSPDDDLEEVDAIIVTVINEFEFILKKLQRKVKAKIISLEEILYEIDSDECK